MDLGIYGALYHLYSGTRQVLYTEPGNEGLESTTRDEEVVAVQSLHWNKCSV